MSKCYFELRGNATHSNINLATDIMRHLHARQYLGKAVVVCEHPAVFLAAAHKQWYKLSRSIQQRRSSSVDADKILKYTRAITHMQHMRFTTKTPLEDTTAGVYFLRKDQLSELPANCFSVYATTALLHAASAELLTGLPAEALIVDYTQQTPWEKLDVAPKKTLETRVSDSWKQVSAFLSGHSIRVQSLFDGSLHDVEAMDDALDTLLAHSHSFLQVADGFRHILELARPVRLAKHVREQYDVLILLAHRVQALSSNGFTQRFLETYNEDDAFFLYDSGREYSRRSLLSGENLSVTITRHVKAGRHHLAHALRRHALAH